MAVQDEGEDKLTTENRYIQRYAWPSPPSSMCRLTKTISCIDALPTTIEKALEQVERSTGMKAIILIGGPTPKVNGDISTHW